MTESGVPAASRRIMRACACAACAAALAGCALYSSKGRIDGGQSAPSSPEPGGPDGSRVLATTAEIPVGGGKILTTKKIVITQPQAGSFDAFTAIRTHLGCTVNTVAGGTIDCSCHGSKFSISDGSVVKRPGYRVPCPDQHQGSGNSIAEA